MLGATPRVRQGLLSESQSTGVVTIKPGRDDSQAVVLVAVGGVAGANLRYLGALLVPSTLAATAAVNVVGCLVLGFLLALDREGGVLSQPQKHLLVTGLVGSFTTYSTFVVDALESTPATAVGYVAASYTLGFAAVILGQAGAHTLTEART